MNYQRFIASFILSLICLSVSAQFRTKTTSANLYVANFRQLKPIAWLTNQTQISNYAPILSTTAAMPVNQMNSYWLTQMTTQSLKEGKVGTNYFWDQQGNLRESRFFIDVGGKRKPGLKLVIPRR